MKFLRDLTKTSSMKALGAHQLDVKYPSRDRIAPELDPSSSEYDEELCKHLTGTLYHPAGSCKMGAVGDSSAVVDPYLRFVAKVFVQLRFSIKRNC